MQQISAYESIDKKVFSTPEEAMKNDLLIVLSRKYKDNNEELIKIIDIMLSDNEVVKMFTKYNDYISPKIKTPLMEGIKDIDIADILNKKNPWINEKKTYPYIQPQVIYNTKE